MINSVTTTCSFEQSRDKVLLRMNQKILTFDEALAYVGNAGRYQFIIYV